LAVITGYTNIPNTFNYSPVSVGYVLKVTVTNTRQSCLCNVHVCWISLRAVIFIFSYL